MIRRQVHIFLTAVMFYTRIPCPKGMEYSEELLNRSTRYFPLIGWIVGAFSALVFWGTSYILPISIAVLFSMISSILLTGAFHEDGFADVCDGFGGGYHKSQILNIMKDSRIGTYGTIGLVLILLLKFALLNSMEPIEIIILLPIAHILSRMAPVFVIFSSVYSRDDASSKVKPIGKSLTNLEFIVAIFLTVIPILFLLNYMYLTLLLPVFLIQFLLRKYFEKHLGGYTGDCLGTTQQVSEIAIYIGAIVLLQYFPI